MHRKSNYGNLSSCDNRYNVELLEHDLPGETLSVAQAHSMLLMFWGAKCISFVSHSDRKSCKTFAAGCTSILQGGGTALISGNVKSVYKATLLSIGSRLAQQLKQPAVEA